MAAQAQQQQRSNGNGTYQQIQRVAPATLVEKVDYGEYQFTRAEVLAVVDMIYRADAKAQPTPEEIMHFLYVCRQRKLNPLLGQIHCIYRWNQKAGRHTPTHQVSIDGLRAIADRSAKYAPGRPTEFDYGEPIIFIPGTSKAIPYTATAWVIKYVQGHAHEYGARVHWDEYAQTFQGGDLMGLWKTHPHVMLGKCAEAAALRRGWPEDLSGLYDSAEMGNSALIFGDNTDYDRAEHELARGMSGASTTTQHLVPALPAPVDEPDLKQQVAAIQERKLQEELVDDRVTVSNPPKKRDVAEAETHAEQGELDPEPATQRQVRALERIIEERGIDIQAEMRSLFGEVVPELSDLTSDEAGELLTICQQRPRKLPTKAHAERKVETAATRAAKQAGSTVPQSVPVRQPEQDVEIKIEKWVAPSFQVDPMLEPVNSKHVGFKVATPLYWGIVNLMAKVVADKQTGEFVSDADALTLGRFFESFAAGNDDRVKDIRKMFVAMASGYIDFGRWQDGMAWRVPARLHVKLSEWMLNVPREQQEQAILCLYESWTRQQDGDIEEDDEELEDVEAAADEDLFSTAEQPIVEPAPAAAPRSITTWANTALATNGTIGHAFARFKNGTALGALFAYMTKAADSLYEGGKLALTFDPRGMKRKDLFAALETDDRVTDLIVMALANKIAIDD